MSRTESSPAEAGTVRGREPQSSGTERLRTLSARPWVRETVALAIACTASLVIAAVAMRLWDSPDLRVPLISGGDGLAALASFKGISDWGWIWTNQSLGAPLGQTFYDYGSYGPDNLHWAMAWVIERVAQQPGAVYNGIVLISFPLSAASAYGAMRALRVSRLAAIAPAALFAVVPYHVLRGEVGHIMLADTVAVPIGVYLALAVALGLPLFRRREGFDGPRPLAWASWTTIRTALLLVVIASTGIYYATFAILFILVTTLAALLTRPDRKPILVTSGALLAGLGGVLLFNLAPTIIYHRIHGPNAVVGQRNPNESLVYGLNLIGQILPPPTHRFGPFSSLGKDYWDKSTLQSEGPTWGGTLSVIGLLVLTLTLVAAVAGTTRRRLLGDARLRATSLIMVTAAFFGATGAGGAIVAFVLNPSLRGWNRIGIVLSFCGLLAVAIGLQALREWLARREGRGPVIGFAALVPILLVFGAWDQTWSAMRPPYERTQAEWSNDAHFVAAISATLGGRGEVYQVPYLPFPESPPILGMTDYSPLKGYVHADKALKWSYAAMKGRPEDWQEEASQLPLEQQLRAVALAGFDGLWVDKFGYANPDGEVLVPAQRISGRVPITSADGRLAFFDLRPLRARLRAEIPAATADAVGPELTHPVQLAYGSGFYPEEHDARTSWRWATNEAQVSLDNPMDSPRRMSFLGRLSSGRRSTVTFKLDGRPVGTNAATPLPGSRAKVSFVLPPGRHTLTLSGDAPATTAAAGDLRDLRVQVLDGHLQDEALATLSRAGR